jgi:hypothetical protein
LRISCAIEADSRPSEVSVSSSARRDSSEVSSRKINTCESSFGASRVKRGTTSGTPSASWVAVSSSLPEVIQ